MICACQMRAHLLLSGGAFYGVSMVRLGLHRLRKGLVPPVAFEERFFVSLFILPFSIWIAAFGIEDFLFFNSCEQGIFIELFSWYRENCKSKNLGDAVGTLWLIFCASYMLIPFINKIPKASLFASIALIVHASYFGVAYGYHFFLRSFDGNDAGHIINLFILTVYLYLIFFVKRSAAHAYIKSN